MSTSHPQLRAICKDCIGTVTNGSLVALVQRLRACPACRTDIAAATGTGYRMLCLAINRFNSGWIAEEWENQNKKEWIQEMETKYGFFGLSLKVTKNKIHNWVVHMEFKRAPGGDVLSMKIEKATITEALQKAAAWMADLTKPWPLVPDKTRTNPTTCIVKPGPSFTEEEPTTGIVRKRT
jgi:hypothetical protein